MSPPKRVKERIYPSEGRIEQMLYHKCGYRWMVLLDGLVEDGFKTEEEADEFIRKKGN
jgi:hypothetical protein